MREATTRKFAWPFITWRTWGQVKNWRNYIFNFTRPDTAKLGSCWLWGWASEHKRLSYHLLFVFFRWCFRNGLAKFCCQCFIIHYLGSMWPSLDKVANIVIMSCTLETNSNDRIKWQHVKSCPLTTKSIVPSLSQPLWPSNLVGWWLTIRGSHSWINVPLWSRSPMRSRDKLIWQNIFTKRMAMETAVGGIVTYFNGLLLKKLRSFLIACSCKIACQTETIISPLSRCLWPPNLAGL